MARARNVKPGFFTNDALGALDPLARILFIGIWCHADRAGRLLDRPRKLKAEILPYDECDADRLTQDLHGAGMVQRYVVDGIKYIQCVNFTKHQHPHIKEPESIIPEPDLSGAKTSDSLLLIPDSLKPIKPVAQSDESLHAVASVNGFSSIPLADKSEFHVPQDLLNELEAAYPAVDPESTLREIRVWCIANPNKKKTRRGCPKFLNRWFERVQNG